MRMVTSSKASLSVLLLGLLLTILSYPFKAGDAGKLSHGPSETTLGEVIASKLEGGDSETGSGTYLVEYRFVVQRRVFQGECWMELPAPPHENLAVQYLVEDPRVNCLAEGYLVSWTGFLGACFVTAVGGIWFLIVFFLRETAEKPKKREKQASSSRGRKKSRRRNKRR